MCIHLFLIPIKTYADPDKINITPAIDKPGVILGISGSGSECVVAVPFVAVFSAVCVGVFVALIVDVNTLEEMVLDREVELKFKSVEASG
jgi:hypothetical protein